MLEIIGWIVGAVLLAGLAIAAYASVSRPNSFTISRSAMIAAPSDKIFAIVNDFRRWPEWSPWQHMDPNMKQTLSGPPAGVGAAVEWSGNKMVGAGRTEIVASEPPSRLAMRLDMHRPMKASNDVAYSFVPRAGGTEVTWTMRGAQPLPAKIFATFVDCDAMVGKDFERGLANLKALAER